MIPGIAGFLVGDLLLQTLPVLPSKNMYTVLLVFSICCYGWVRHNRITSIILASMLAGFLFSAWAAQSRLTAFPVFDESKPLRVTGYIASIPHSEFQSMRFLFSVGHAKIALSWKHPPRPLRVGDQWTVWMLLKHIHDVNNYPLPDADRLFFQKKIVGNGTVFDSRESIFHKRAWFLFPITSFRAYYQARLVAYPFHNLPWLSALLIGEHFGATQQAWQMLRQTGTNHLMAVAGLHMGWLFGISQTLFKQGWRFFPPLLLWMPAQLASMGVACLVTLGYG